MRNTKLLAVLLSVLLVCAGCNNSEVKQGHNGDLSIIVYTVKGKPLECVSMIYRLSCNWEKHNNIDKTN